MSVKPNSLFVILVGLAVLLTVFILNAVAKLASLILLPASSFFVNKTAGFCQRIANVSLVVLSLLIIAALLYAVISMVKIAYLQRGIQANKIPLSATIKTILRQLDVSCARVILYNSHDASIFCAGFVKPTIYLSTGLTRNLSAMELTAILAHEAAHLKSYDPLRTLLTFLIGGLLRFVPFIQALTRKIRLVQETTADKYAAEIVGKKTYLRTILKVDELQLAQSAATVLGFDSFINQRVSSLLGKHSKASRQQTTIRPSINTLILCALVVIALLPFPTRAQTGRSSSGKTACQISYLSDCCMS